MDGFCDTVDALSSNSPAERKREILKDTHIGAFAAVAASAYLLAYFALCTELARDSHTVLLVCLIPVTSRTVSGLVSVCSDLDGAGLLHAMRGAARHTIAGVTLFVWFGLCAAGMVLLEPVAGAGMAILAAASAFGAFRMSRKQFGGMSGDAAGFLLQVTELAMLFGLVFLQRVVGL